MDGAGLTGFLLQGAQLSQGHQLITAVGMASLLWDDDDDRILERQDIDNFAGAEWRPDAFIAAGQLFARLNVLFVFVDQATAQAPAHTGDF